MNTVTLTLVCSLLLSISMPHVSYSQQRETGVDSDRPMQHQLIFEDVEQGITNSNIALVARHFAPQVSVNLRGDESGTFSSNQTYYVLGDYLKARRFAKFEFSTVEDSNTNPYATGEAEFTINGSRERVQVYVALSHVGEKYLITRLTIY